MVRGRIWLLVISNCSILYYRYKYNTHIHIEGDNVLTIGKLVDSDSSTFISLLGIHIRLYGPLITSIRHEGEICKVRGGAFP